MSSAKYIGMDVHKESISIAVRNAAGKIPAQSSGLRSKKNSSRRRCVFLDFDLYRTNRDLCLVVLRIELRASQLDVFGV